MNREEIFAAIKTEVVHQKKIRREKGFEQMTLAGHIVTAQIYTHNAKHQYVNGWGELGIIRYPDGVTESVMDFMRKIVAVIWAAHKDMLGISDEEVQNTFKRSLVESKDDPEIDSINSPADFLLYMTEHLKVAAQKNNPLRIGPSMFRLKNAAVLAIACMEIFGVNPRTSHNTVMKK